MFIRLFDLDEETEPKTKKDQETATAETAAPAVEGEPEAAASETTTPTTTDENATPKQKKEWIVNLWLKRQVANKLPNIKPIPGFCEFSNFCPSILLIP